MLDVVRNEGRSNKTVIFTYFSEKDGMNVTREGFPYEVKGQIFYYYDFEKSDVRTFKLSNLMSVKPTGRINPGAPYPCKL